MFALLLPFVACRSPTLRHVSTPSPTPNPCQWASLSRNDGWDFGDSNNDGKADYFRWAIADMVEVRLRFARTRQLGFDRSSFRAAFGPAAGVVPFVCAVLSTVDDGDGGGGGGGGGGDGGGGGGGGMTARTVCASPCAAMTKKLLAAMRDPGLARRVAHRMGGSGGSGGSGSGGGRISVLSVKVIPPPPRVNVGRASGSSPASFPAVLRASGERVWAFGGAANLLLPGGLGWLSTRTRLQWVLFDLGPAPRRVAAVTLELWGNRGSPKTAFLQAGDAPNRVRTVAKVAVGAPGLRSVTVKVRQHRQQHAPARSSRSPRGGGGARLATQQQQQQQQQQQPPAAMRYYRLFVSENWGAKWGVGFERIVFHCVGADGRGPAACSSGAAAAAAAVGGRQHAAELAAAGALGILLLSAAQLRRRAAAQSGARGRLEGDDAAMFELGQQCPAATPYAPLSATQ